MEYGIRCLFFKFENDFDCGYITFYRVDDNDHLRLIS